MMEMAAFQTLPDFLMHPTEISIAIFTLRARIQSLSAAEHVGSSTNFPHWHPVRHQDQKIFCLGSLEIMET